MVRAVLKSKIHRIKITGADLNYEGSLTLDEDLMERANLVPFEKIEVYNVNNGQRFSTYVIPGERYSRQCILNGAAARLGHKGDVIIIASYVQVNEEQLKDLKIDLVYMNDQDNIVKEHKRTSVFEAFLVKD